MNDVTCLVAPTSAPDDTTGIARLEAVGLDPSDVLAVIGKTEGNGCVNDFSRGFAALAWSELLSPDAITIFSGGTEGVLSPHVNLLVRDTRRHEGYGGGLVAAAGRTRRLALHERGGVAHMDLVAQTTTALIDQIGVGVGDVHLVLVKCPLLTSDQIQELRKEAGLDLQIDPYASMSRSRAASALGAAVALGDVGRTQATAALTDDEGGVWSSRVSASAGHELDDCHVLVVAVDPKASNPLRALHVEMRDALDIAPVLDAMASIEAQGGRVVQMFAKAEADPTGAIRGLRHTMLTDSDINSTRHARAAVGGLLAALKGDGAVYVSGGAEHQGPPGGGGLTILFEVPPAAP